MLLAHPTGFHGRVWAPVVPRLLDAGHAVYSFDFRGHGDSDPSPNGYAWTNFAADAAAVAAHFQIAGADNLIAAGHSKGAAAILLAEIANPGTFRRVWAYEPIMFPHGVSPFAGGSDPLAEGARRRRNEWASLDAVFAAYSSRPPLSSLSSDALHAYINYGFRDRGDGVFELKCAPATEAAVYEHGAANGLFEQLDRVAANVRIVLGHNTNAITPKLGARIQAQLANATLEIWETNGHFGPQENPKRAADSILSMPS